MINKTGKTITIFVVLIIILLLSSTCIGFYLYHLEERLHKNVETQLDSAHADGLKLQTQLKEIQTQLALAQDKNKEADEKINNLLDEQDLNEGLRAALKKENADLKAQMVTLDLSKQKLKADLDDADSKLSQYQDLLKTSEDKTKALETRIASLVETNKSNEAKINELMTAAAAKQVPVVAAVPPASGGTDKMELGKIVVKSQDGAQGHILTVDTDAEFVIFNMGLKQGIKPDDLLSVYRGNDYLGDVKVTRARDEISAADIIPPLSSKEIQINDTVVLKP